MVVELERITEMAELEGHNTEIKCAVSLDTRDRIEKPRDRIEKLVEDGRFWTISNAVGITLEELIHNIEGIPYAMRETRCEMMQVADAFRAKIRKDIGKRLRIPKL